MIKILCSIYLYQCYLVCDNDVGYWLIRSSIFLQIQYNLSKINYVVPNRY